MRKRMIRIMRVVLLVILGISCCQIARELGQRKQESEQFAKLAELVEVSTEMDTETMEALVSETETVLESIEETEPSQRIRKRDLEPILEQNPDCVGWVCIPDTEVNYPVMHTPEEPQKYLHRNFEGEESASGTPFLQDTSTLASDHLVIYGHNMKNGTMFGSLKQYLDSDYAEAHPVIELETAEGLHNYTIIAAAIVRSRDIWYYFRNAESEEQYDQLVAGILERAEYVSGIVPEYGQQLLTLSTCYGTQSDDRLIVIGVEK